MLCECGAPARDGVCQRGHRLEETWSPAARLAALVARRKNLADRGRQAMGVRPAEDTSLRRRGEDATFGGGVEKQEGRYVSRAAAPIDSIRSDVHKQIKGLQHGESVSFNAPEGVIHVTHSAHRGGVHVFHVSGGGQHLDADMQRGPRNVIGHREAALEVAERIHHSYNADQAHSRDTVAQVHRAEPGKEFKVASMDGHIAAITPREDGSFHVKHDDAAIPEHEHPTARAAVDELKARVRVAGGKFLGEGHDSDPLSTLPKRAVEKQDVKEFARNRSRWDKVGEKIDDTFRPDPGPDALKDVVREKLLSSGGLAGSNVGGSALPERMRELGHEMSAVGGAHEHVSAIASHAAALAAPHAAHMAHLAPHAATIIHLVHAAERAESDLEEASRAGDSRAIVTVRARLHRIDDRLGELCEAHPDVEVAWLQHHRGDAERPAVGGAGGEPARQDATVVVECAACGAPRREDARVCQRGHRLGM